MNTNYVTAPKWMHTTYRARTPREIRANAKITRAGDVRMIVSGYRVSVQCDDLMVSEWDDVAGCYLRAWSLTPRQIKFAQRLAAKMLAGAKEWAQLHPGEIGALEGDANAAL